MNTMNFLNERFFKINVYFILYNLIKILGKSENRLLITSLLGSSVATSSMWYQFKSNFKKMYQVIMVIEMYRMFKNTFTAPQYLRCFFVKECCTLC